MKLSLFKIEQEYLALAEQLLDNGGEITTELSEALQINQQNLETKGINYGFVCKTMESEIDIIDSEIKRLMALKLSRNKSIDRLKETITKAMELYEITEIKSPVLKLSFRKSESVEIDTDAIIDKDYMVEKITLTPDKAALKVALNAGENIQGVTLKIKNNLQIK